LTTIFSNGLKAPTSDAYSKVSFVKPSSSEHDFAFNTNHVIFEKIRLLL